MNSTLSAPSAAGLLSHHAFLTLVAALAAGTISCSSTTTQSQPAAQRPPSGARVQSVVVVTADDSRFVREAFETQLAGRLQDRRVEATVSYTRVSLSELGGGQEAVRARLESLWKADAVLVCQLVDTERTTLAPAASRSGNDWDETWTRLSLSRYETAAWSGEAVTRLAMESKLYRLSDAALLWSARTDTLLKEDADRLERIKKVAAQVVQRMAKDGMIP